MLDWSWLQDKMYNMIKIVNEKSFQFHIDRPEGELKYIQYDTRTIISAHRYESYGWTTKKTYI